MINCCVFCECCIVSTPLCIVVNSWQGVCLCYKKYIGSSCELPFEPGDEGAVDTIATALREDYSTLIDIQSRLAVWHVKESQFHSYPSVRNKLAPLASNLSSVNLAPLASNASSVGLEVGVRELVGQGKQVRSGTQ